MKEIHIKEVINGYQVKYWDEEKKIWRDENFTTAINVIGWLGLDLTDYAFSVTLMPTDKHNKEKDNG